MKSALRSLSFLFGALLLIWAPQASLAQDGLFKDFRKGINLARLHNLPARDPSDRDTYLWPPFRPPLGSISDGEISTLREAGFTFVRLPVAPGPILENTGEKRDRLMADLFDTIRRLQAFGLAVLVDPHPTHRDENWSAPDILEQPGSAPFMGYLNWLKTLAARLADFPPGQTALGLMNEPQSECFSSTQSDWTDIQPVFFEQVRAVAPTLTLVVTPGCWSSFDGLEYLSMTPFDANTLVDVHYYAPYYFTHQSLDFASAPTRFMAGLTYPAKRADKKTSMEASRDLLQLRQAKGSESSATALSQARLGTDHYYSDPQIGKDYVLDKFSVLDQWVKDTGISAGQVIIGEFGASRPPVGLPVTQDRYNWLRDVRQTAESRGYGFAYWDYNAGDGYPGFGLVIDNESRKLDPNTLKALGLKVP